MKKSTKTLLMLLVFLCCTGFDQLSKSVAQQFLAGTPARSYLGGLVQLQYLENSGAMLGMGGDLPFAIRMALLVILNTVLLVAMLHFIWNTHDLQPMGITGGMLVIAGGFNNVFDRLVNGGRVVDFIHIGFERLRTGVFNFADVAIMAGMALLFLSLSRAQQPAAEQINRTAD